jgi:hypothetical protein
MYKCNVIIILWECNFIFLYCIILLICVSFSELLSACFLLYTLHASCICIYSYTAKIKSRIHLKNICYHSVQDPLSSHLLSRNIGCELSQGFWGCDANVWEGLPVFIFISSWKWRQHGSLKYWYPTTSLHSVTTQKTLTWIFTAIKTSYLT